MTRRGLFSAIAGAIAGREAAAPVYKDPLCTGEWRIERVQLPFEADCETCFPFVEGGVVEWIVLDRSTNVSRMVCARCKDDFLRQPVRLLLFHSRP